MLSRMKQLISNAYHYRPIWHSLKRFGEEAYDSADNIHWTFAKEYPRIFSKTLTVDARIAEYLTILNSYTEEECRQHFNNKSKEDVFYEYLGHRRVFFIAFIILCASISYNFSPAATQSVITLLVGPVGIIATGLVYLPLYSWRCWQARVGGNYPPHRFAAALLRNPLQLLP